MVNRRTVLIALGLGGTFSLSTLAQQPEKQARNQAQRIATLSDGDESSTRHLWTIFRSRLRELGYVEGVAYIIEPRWAAGNVERLNTLAADLAALMPAVIVTDGTPAALAATRATSSVAIVACRLANPVKTGLVASLARPGGNLTGTAIATTDIAGKWLELLREVAPGLKSLAFLTDTSNAGGRQTFRELQERARPFGVQVQALDGRTTVEVRQAFNTIARDRIDGLIVGTTPVVFAQRRQIVEAAARQRTPVVYARSEYVDAGGLMSYGANLAVHYSHAAEYVHRILQGARPADLPIEQPTGFELWINLRAAHSIGVRIPHSTLLRASKLIE